MMVEVKVAKAGGASRYLVCEDGFADEVVEMFKRAIVEKEFVERGVLEEGSSLEKMTANEKKEFESLVSNRDLWSVSVEKTDKLPEVFDETEASEAAECGFEI